MLKLGSENGESGPTINDPVPAQSPPPASTVADNVEGAENAASVATPGQEDEEAAQAVRASTPGGTEKEAAKKREQSVAELIRIVETQDRILPILPLTQAINMSIEAGSSGDDVTKERKKRDFYGGVLCTGGGVLIPNFEQFLEEELLASQPRFKKEIIVKLPPREIDPQVLMWKGASVFGQLQGTKDLWISQLEYNRLDSRILAYKCLWQW